MARTVPATANGSVRRDVEQAGPGRARARQDPTDRHADECCGTAAASVANSSVLASGRPAVANNVAHSSCRLKAACSTGPRNSMNDKHDDGKERHERQQHD